MSNKINLKKGLGTEEVARQKELSLQNNYEENVAKSTKDTIFDNVATLFNFLNFVIAVCLLFVGVYSNLASLAIIIVNMLTGIFQEIHVRSLVQKLFVVAKENVHVVRDGVQQEIDTKELVMEDIIIISIGEQVPSDMEVIDGKVEASEALLTDGSDLIEKGIGDTSFSGSLIVSGQAYARVIHVGTENYTVKITQEAKVHKPIQSELANSIHKVSKFISWVTVPLGITLSVEALWLRDAGIKMSVIASAAVLLGMLSKGLVLLISIALTIGAIKLAKERILI